PGAAGTSALPLRDPLPIAPTPLPPPATATPRPGSNPAPGPVAGTHGVTGQLTLCSGKLTYAVQERVCFVEWIKNNTAEPISYGVDRKSTRLNSSHVKISYA